MPTLNLLSQHLTLLQKLLKNHVPNAEVWAYGSRVTGGAHETSDLDIVLRNTSDITKPTPNLPILIDALQKSMLPIMVEVHDWAKLPETFHLQIKRGYIVIQK